MMDSSTAGGTKSPPDELPAPLPEDGEVQYDEPLKEEEDKGIHRKFSITQSDFATPLKRVKKNITKGSYRDLEHYLHVHSDLMVEDYKASLRSTIKSIAGQVRDKQNRTAPPCEEIQSLVKEVLQEEGYVSESSSESGESLEKYAGLLEEAEQEPRVFNPQVHVHHNVTFLYEEHVNEMYCYRIRIDQKMRSFAVDDGFWKGNALHFTEDLEHFYLGQVVWVISKSRELTVGFVSKPAGIKFNTNYVMFEPKAFYQLYHGIVEAIESTATLPMEKYLVYCDVSTIKPPGYLTQDMCYRVDDRTLQVMGARWPEIAMAGLNESQSVALRSALSQEFAMIHGPPGTGKTHVAAKILQVLLANRQVHKQTPVLVLSQTNIALDNLLERVLEFEDEGIVRVGCRSNSELLEPYNLNKTRMRRADWPTQHSLNRDRLAYRLEANLLMAIDAFDGIVSFNTFGRCYDFVNDFGHCYEQFNGRSEMVDWLMEEATVEDASSVDFDIKEAVDKLDIKSEHCYRLECTGYKPLTTLKVLKENFEKLETEMLEKPTEEGLPEMYKSTGLDILYLHKRLQEGKALLQDETFDYSCYIPPTDEFDSVYELHPDKRWRLYFAWLKIAKIELQHDIDRMGVWHRAKHLKRLQQRRDIDLTIFKKKLLIGMTTSGAVFHKKTLEQLRPSIVLVEEASEVLESHIIAALTPHCQHLILIGDHKQLRPMTAHQGVGKKLGLGISLFERMVNNKMQVNMLDVQHRMHPQIADLVMPVYPQLKNHFSTCARSQVCCIAKPVYFLHHTRPETGCVYTKSKMNVYEAWFCCHLAQHLIRMGHDPRSITIMAAYALQVREIRSIIDGMVVNLEAGIEDGNSIVPVEDLTKVKVTTLDGFQGQENDIVLLSLVRNNAEGEIGFLNEDNRITVALSRAKIGLYILGNIKMLSDKSKLWNSVRLRLINQNALVQSLPLQHSNCINESQQNTVRVKELHEVLDAHKCKCLSTDDYLLCQQKLQNCVLEDNIYVCTSCEPS